MSDYFKSYTPRVRVLIKEPISAEVLFIASDDLMSISTNKAYGRCSGTWQMMLPNRSICWKTSDGSELDWYEVLEPDQLVTIEMDAGNGAGFFPVMCGLIDRKSRVTQNGLPPQRAVKVSGRDMGKLLETHDVAFDIVAYNRSIAAQDGTLKDQPAALTRIFNPQMSMGTPSSILNAAFEICISQMLETAQRIAFVSDCQDSFQMCQPNLMTSQGVSFWHYAQQVEHSPFNVLTTDTARADVNSFMMLLEQTPFHPVSGRVDRPSSRWHTINETEITDEDLGVSDHERINLVSYQPAIYLYAKVATADVMMSHADLTRLDTESVGLHGLSSHVFRDYFTPAEMDGLSDADQARQFAALNTASGAAEILWNRYRENHTHESGTLTVHLRPDIRVGDGLLICRGSKYTEYLIEQVIHQGTFNPKPQFVTTLHLTRGQAASPGAIDQARPLQPVETLRG